MLCTCWARHKLQHSAWKVHLAEDGSQNSKRQASHLLLGIKFCLCHYQELGKRRLPSTVIYSSNRNMCGLRTLLIDLAFSALAAACSASNTLQKNRLNRQNPLTKGSSDTVETT